jgi:hypothetical protein
MALPALQPGTLEQLCDKVWHISYQRVNGTIMQVPAADYRKSRPWVSFGKDHVFSNGMDGVTDKGTWSYDEKTRELSTTEGGEGGTKTVLKIRKLTADSLELETGGQVMGMVRKPPFE